MSTRLLKQAADELAGYQQALRETRSGTATVQPAQLLRWSVAAQLAIVALENKDALLAQSLGYLAHLWDRGPADEGWQSDELVALVEAIRKEIGQ
jgi:hypothetical protein